ncbi:hypothetical protein KAT92_05085 [Candidatus Babeliales bacterium]|nr:hypothetical protein [Candidatus Babeliales bacterium]
MNQNNIIEDIRIFFNADIVVLKEAYGLSKIKLKKIEERIDEIDEYVILIEVHYNDINQLETYHKKIKSFLQQNRTLNVLKKHKTDQGINLDYIIVPYRKK